MQGSGRQSRTWLAGGLLLAVAAALATSLVTSPPPEAERAGLAPPEARAATDPTSPGDAPPADRPPEATLKGKDEAARARAEWTIRVRFQDEDGEPFADRDVSVRLHTREPLRYEARTSAAGDVVLGPYRTPRPEEGMYFYVDSPTHDATEVGLLHADPAADGAPRLEALVTLVEIPVLRGRIRLPDGVPASAAVAWLRSRGPRVGLHHGGLDGERIALDENGRFSLTRWVGERGCEIEATVAHEGRRWYGTLPVGEQDREVQVSLGPIRPGDPALLHVERLAPEGLSPPPWSSLWGATRDGLTLHGSRLRDLEDDEGKHLFLYDPDALLLVTTPGVDGLGSARVGPFSARRTEVQIRSEKEWTLSGTVRTEEGQPVEGAKVRLCSPLPLDLRWPLEEETGSASATTGPGGAFTLGGLGALRYRVEVDVDPEIGVAEGGEATPDQGPLAIVVRRVPSVRLRVVDDAGAPVPAAKVVVLAPPPGVVLDPDEPPFVDWSLPGEYDHVATGLTSEAGEWEFDGLAPERRYVLRVGPPGELPLLDSLEIQGWSPFDDTVVLPSGLLIEGRVEDQHGEPLGHVYVRARALGDVPGAHPPYRIHGGGSGAYGLYAWTRDGTFRLGPVPAGRYQLWVDGSDARTVSDAGARDVVLRGEPYETNDTWVFRIAGWTDADRGAWALLDRGDAGLKRGRVTLGGWLMMNHVDLVPGREIWIGGLAGGRYVWGRNLKAPASPSARAEDADPDDLGFDVTRLEVERGGVIRGRVETVDGRALDAWDVEPVLPLSGHDRAGRTIGACPCRVDVRAGTFEIEGVPPGTWTVRVKGQSEGEVVEGAAEARAGESIVVRLGSP